MSEEDQGATETAEVTEREVPEFVEFKHPFFKAVLGAYFRVIDLTDERVMVMPLDTGQVELKINSIQKELKLANDSADTHMLKMVEQSLSYVQGIKAGDKIPTEMHSGKPSWKVTDSHRAIAKGRVSMQLVGWLSGDEEIVTDVNQLSMVMEDPTMKSKINEAFGQAAEKMGLGRDRRHEVVEMVDELGDELASIEALRTQLERLAIVETRIDELAEIYKAERGTMETINNVQRLCKISMTDFRNDFDQLDAQTGEILAVLKNLKGQIKFIREFRDDMHRRFWAWWAIVEKWEKQPARRGKDAEAVLQDTYHFLAQRFLPQNEWELFYKAQEKAAEKASESVW